MDFIPGKELLYHDLAKDYYQFPGSMKIPSYLSSGHIGGSIFLNQKTSTPNISVECYK